MEEGHVGQHRASLQVKDGGFALQNFACKNEGKILEYYDFEEQKLGEGAFGTVRRATDKRTGYVRAVKSIPKPSGTSANKNSKMLGKDEMAALMEEIGILSILDHPNIARLCESFEDRRFVYLVLELCSGGELFERICQEGSFTEHVAAICVRHMLLAINYLHTNHIIHRDLKPENWLLGSKDEVGKSSLKLIDFGISKRYKAGEALTTKCGTPNYVAPEVLSGRYNEKVDTWSIGVITYIMLCGRQPFQGTTTEEILKSVMRGEVQMNDWQWRKITTEAKGLVRALLQKQPGVRPSATQALKHRWIEYISSEEAASAVAMSKIDIRSLRNFGRMHRLQQAALTCIATQLSDDRIEGLSALFNSIDVNRSGTISPLELARSLKQAGVQVPKGLQAIMENVDTDGSGVLDYTEFIAATMDRKLFHKQDVVWAAFRKFDLDGSGVIDKTEIARILGESQVKEVLGDESDISFVFEQVDKNGDGVIDFQEFFDMVCEGKNSNLGSVGIASAKSRSSNKRSTKARSAPLDDTPQSEAERRSRKDNMNQTQDRRTSPPSTSRSRRTSSPSSSISASAMSPRRRTGACSRKHMKPPSPKVHAPEEEAPAGPRSYKCDRGVSRPADTPPPPKRVVSSVTAAVMASANIGPEGAGILENDPDITGAHRVRWGM